MTWRPGGCPRCLGSAEVPQRRRAAAQRLWRAGHPLRWKGSGPRAARGLRGQGGEPAKWEEVEGLLWIYLDLYDFMGFLE